MTIITDDRGVPIPRPEREDYPSTVDYLRACWAYKDRITSMCNKAFDDAFRKEIAKP